MNWHLQCPDGRTVPLAEDSDTLVGAVAHAQVRLATLPERCAVIQHLDGDVWLQVLAEDAHVGVNGRPVQRLSRLRAGDRICFGGTCIDLVRPERPGPAGRVADFFLRVRNGPRSGNVHRGPVLHLDEEGEVVSAAAGRVGLVLADGAVRLAPNGTRLRLNGVPVTGEVVAVDGDQIQIGQRRYLVETLDAPQECDVPTQRMAVQVGPDADGNDAGTRPAAGHASGLWGLVLLAALIASGVAVLLYFHSA